MYFSTKYGQLNNENRHTHKWSIKCCYILFHRAAWDLEQIYGRVSPPPPLKETEVSLLFAHPCFFCLWHCVHVKTWSSLFHKGMLVEVQRHSFLNSALYQASKLNASAALAPGKNLPVRKEEETGWDAQLVCILYLRRQSLNPARNGCRLSSHSLVTTPPTYRPLIQFSTEHT